MTEPTDIFYVIGFNREDILRGGFLSPGNLVGEITKASNDLHRRFGALDYAAETGVLVKRMVEVYFLDPYGEENPEFRKLFDKYQVIDFYSETAFELCQRFGITLPAVISTTTREKLPDEVGTLLLFPTCTVA